MSESDAQLTPEEPSAPLAGTVRRVALRNLFLDPNNYRFIDQKEYVPALEEKIMDPDVQRRTTSFILGKDSEEVNDLIASFKKNGWLPLDQIQVREIIRGKYLVVEGNRRVATLQYLARRYMEGGIDLGSLDPKLFDAVAVVLYEDAGDAHHKVIMGLGHISGKRRWPPVNQARLLKSLLTDDMWSEDEVCKAIGVGKRELRSMMKTLSLCDLYKSSDYGDQFVAEKYNLFREIVRSRDVSNWIKWNDTTNRPDSQANVNRLFSWISREEESQTDEDTETQIPSDPVISTGSDVRELAKIVMDENALRTLDETRRLTDATFSSAVLVQDRISEGLTRISDSIGILFNHAPKLNEEQIAQVQTALKKLHGVIAVRDRQPALIGERLERRPFNMQRAGHFTELLLTSYRQFQDTTIAGLKRVNLFVGPNNSGKTSLLEAVNLLVSQNDIDELLRVIRWRGKLTNDPPAIWVREQLEKQAVISGRFDAIAENLAEVVIKNETDGEDLDDKTFYVASLEVIARYGSHRQTATTHLFQKPRERITRQQAVTVLCPAVFSSPFVLHDTGFLVDLFNRSVEAGTKDEAVQFIQEKLDAGFFNVDAVPSHESAEFTRFKVTHKTFKTAVDLTQFGEGVQRIFHISLLFAYARGGVVLIDEFENAIHYTLLKAFTRFVQELAVKFDVQVFISSHSKECVDAFVTNDFGLHDVSAYALRRDNGRRVAHHYDGPRLRQLIEVADVDLRGQEAKI